VNGEHTPTRAGRTGDTQPLPHESIHPIAHQAVKADLDARLALGIERYGQPLRPLNGRNALRDAYEEALDLCVYLWCALYEAGHAEAPAALDIHASAEPSDPVEQAYDDFWRDIIEPGGQLDIQQVKRELHDYRTLLEEVPKVYVHVTGGRISKPNTIAMHVIAEADQHYAQDEAEAMREAVQAALIQPDVTYDRPLDVAEAAVYTHLRNLGCMTPVDPADVEDCAFVAVHVVGVLRDLHLVDADTESLVQELEQLRQWKREATELLAGWDRVADAVTARLGERKSDAVARHLNQMADG